MTITTRTLCVCAAALGLTVSLRGAPAQQRPADDWCRDSGRDDDRGSYCEVREYTVPASGATMTVDAAPNGGIRVDGAQRGDILVRARVSAQAGSDEEAKALAGRVQVTATADRVSADGPDNLARREGWSVSYELSVPPRTPLSLNSTNGGISIDNVQSRMDLKTVNGGVTLKRVGGDVRGRTSNGGVTVTLEGSTWDGEGLDIQTSNGGVNLAIPASYSAHLETRTNNGSLRVDFPITVQGRIDRSLSMDIGSGGPTIKVVTSNGGVRVTRR
jgi:hypothetical protein